MLHVQSISSERWLRQVDEHLNDILVDHAHCEQKAASTAMDLMFHIRLQELATAEAAIIAQGCELPRVHS